jgi:hypothetical protein
MYFSDRNLNSDYYPFYSNYVPSNVIERPFTPSTNLFSEDDNDDGDGNDDGGNGGNGGNGGLRALFD